MVIRFFPLVFLLHPTLAQASDLRRRRVAFTKQSAFIYMPSLDFPLCTLDAAICSHRVSGHVCALHHLLLYSTVCAHRVPIGLPSFGAALGSAAMLALAGLSVLGQHAAVNQGLHLFGDSPKVYFGPNKECTLEMSGGAFISDCPIVMPPPHPPMPPTAPPSTPP